MWSGDTYCSGNYHRDGFEYFGRRSYSMSVCLSVDGFCQYDGVATVQDAVMKLYRCVVDIKIKVEFEKGVWSKQVTLIFSASDIFSFCDFVIIKL